ncbi:methyltransferase domain-containing protein [Chitinophaga tropicalis]|uniref:Methyltransferase domain-containing protein n=1 Tax=Chitinophaga tropicalis TaxID=2683588 RepID=A0A7K1U3E7_9BACT|nr:methyltransferase domain-containing protein [Chitinophaga tropicalis]MVT08878.1 methyltransferase domain-containing protein [Chitinophaga tropicalis]
MEIKIEQLYRFQASCKVVRAHTTARNFVEIGGVDATFKKYVPHDSWLILDKYGNPDVVADLDGRTSKLPFEDNSVEYVICTEVLEHLRMGTPLLQEIFRCLRPNGEFFVTVPNAVSLGNRLKWLLGKVPYMAASGDCGAPLGGTGILIDGHWEASHVIDFNKHRLSKYLNRVGFQIDKWYSFGANTGLGFKLPSSLTPISLNDFLAVKVRKPQKN